MFELVGGDQGGVVGFSVSGDLEDEGFGEHLAVQFHTGDGDSEGLVAVVDTVSWDVRNCHRWVYH